MFQIDVIPLLVDSMNQNYNYGVTFLKFLVSLSTEKFSHFN